MTILYITSADDNIRSVTVQPVAADGTRDLDQAVTIGLGDEEVTVEVPEGGKLETSDIADDADPADTDEAETGTDNEG